MIRIVSDIYPTNIKKAVIQDFSGRQLLTLLYKPFLASYQQELEYSQIHLTQKSKLLHEVQTLKYFFVDKKNNTIKLLINENSKWSDGLPLTPEHYINFIKILINTKSDLLFFFTFIEGVEDVMEEIENSNVNIQSHGNTLIVRYTYLPPNLIYFLNSPIWIPSRSEINISHEVTTGRFSISGYSKNCIYLRNNNDSNKTLEYQILKDLYSPIQLFIEQKIDVTCCTYFPFEKIEEWKFDHFFKKQPSNIQYVLRFNCDALPKLLNRKLRHLIYDSINVDNISKNLHYGIIPWKNFFSINQLTQQESEPKKKTIFNRFLYERVSLKYSDYYPNMIIAQQIKEQLMESRIFQYVELVPCSFMHLNDSTHTKDFELLLDLTFPYDGHWFSNAYSHLYNLLDKRSEEEYLSILNNEKDNDIVTALNNYLLSELPFFPLFNANNIYLCNHKKVCLSIGYNGEIHWEEFNQNNNKEVINHED